MKASHLILALQDLVANYGDKEVYTESENDSDPQDITAVFRGYSLDGKVTSFRIESDQEGY